jgi:hypothetical protein
MQNKSPVVLIYVVPANFKTLSRNGEEFAQVAPILDTVVRNSDQEHASRLDLAPPE